MGSYLLKYFAISKLSNIPWTNVNIGKDSRGKPVHIPSSPQHTLKKPVEFNVSHHGGLVAIIAGHDCEVGIDLVCIAENETENEIKKDGFEEWLKTYNKVFSSQDLGAMTSNRGLLIQKNEPGALIHAKIRRFFAYWALKEALVKMTGEALLADWLKETEFTSVKVPEASIGDSHHPWGESVDDIGIKINKINHLNPKMTLTAFEQSCMIATCIRINGTMSISAAKDFVVLELENILTQALSGQ